MRRRIFNVMLIIISSIIIIWGYYYLNKYYNFCIPCIFHKITGFYCPGCGATRCLLSLFRGNIVESYNYNRLFFGLIPFFVFYIIYSIYLYIFKRKDKLLVKIPNLVYIILLVITIAFGILRNISEFSYLAP